MKKPITCHHCGQTNVVKWHDVDGLGPWGTVRNCPNCNVPLMKCNICQTWYYGLNKNGHSCSARTHVRALYCHSCDAQTAHVNADGTVPMHCPICHTDIRYCHKCGRYYFGKNGDCCGKYTKCLACGGTLYNHPNTFYVDNDAIAKFDQDTNYYCQKGHPLYRCDNCEELFFAEQNYEGPCPGCGQEASMKIFSYVHTTSEGVNWHISMVKDEHLLNIILQRLTRAKQMIGASNKQTTTYQARLTGMKIVDQEEAAEYVERTYGGLVPYLVEFLIRLPGLQNSIPNKTSQVIALTQEIVGRTGLLEVIDEEQALLLEGGEDEYDDGDFIDDNIPF